MEHYEKIRKIGEGAFGVAWLANSKITKSFKVIKEIPISRVSALNKTEIYKNWFNMNIIVIAYLRY